MSEALLGLGEKAWFTAEAIVNARMPVGRFSRHTPAFAKLKAQRSQFLFEVSFSVALLLELLDCAGES